MSAINANIVVEPITLNVTESSINQTVTVDPINLSVYTSAPQNTSPGGSDTELQFNNANSFGGLANSSVSSGTLTFSNLANLKIAGGTNGYFLQTDGAGALTWNAGTTTPGSANPGGANTQIQYNDAGSFGGTAGFTFDEVTGNVNIPGIYNGDGGGLSNVTSAFATTAGTVTTAAQPNITSTGTLSALTVSGTTTIQQGIEDVQLIGAQTGTYNFDMLNGSIQYATANAAANLVLNFRGDAGTTTNAFLANGKSVTSTYLLTNGTTPYAITGIEIDGVSQTINYPGGTVPGVSANAISSYTFTLIKTSTTPTYTVLASGTQYF